MMCRIASSDSGAKPTSSSAARKQLTILATESISVPSQSNTIRSNLSFMIQPLQDGRQLRGQRGLDMQGVAVHRMGKVQHRGMKKQPAQPQWPQRPVEGVVPVLIVPGDGV